MLVSLIDFMNYVGTIAFALSGALVGIKRNMDIFGVNILGIVTAVGGGIVRDILIGNIPPLSFRDPFNILLAIITSNICFFFLYYNKKHFSQNTVHIYELFLFWCDTLGLAAFTVGGTSIGLNLPENYGFFFPVFLATMTGVGGGVLRDMFSATLPAIFVKRIYATASLIGSIIICLLVKYLGEDLASIIGFGVVILIRLAAMYYRLDLPKISLDHSKDA